MDQCCHKEERPASQVLQIKARLRQLAGTVCALGQEEHFLCFIYCNLSAPSIAEFSQNSRALELL